MLIEKGISLGPTVHGLIGREREREREVGWAGRRGRGRDLLL